MADQPELSYEDIAPDDNLPGDVMVSILTYLPVKSLMKFKAVSKPWYSFISSSRFFKLHLLRQSAVSGTNSNCLVVLKDDSADRRFGLINLTNNHNNPVDDDVLMLEFPPLLSSKPNHLYIIGSSNGLVCLYSFLRPSSGFVLWNPATRKYRFIDPPKGNVFLRFCTMGFCYVDATNDFKILGWNRSHLPFTVDVPYLYVYSLSSDSWDKFDFFAEKTYIDFEHPTYLGRCMHWLSDRCPNGYGCTCAAVREIVAFDVMDGTMAWFHTPVTCGHHSITVAHTLAFRGRLSIVILHDNDNVDEQDRGFELWVMEEYGIEGSWVKHFFIQKEEFSRVILPLFSWNYDEVVFNCIMDGSGALILYDPYSKKKKCVKFMSFNVLQLFEYVEGLASVESS